MEKKAAPIEAGKVMEVGNWAFLMPQETPFSFEVIRKMCASPEKRDIWSFEDGKFLHLIDDEEQNIHQRLEVTPAQFFDEIDFVMTLCRNNTRLLGDALLKAKYLLQSGQYKPGDYMR